MNENIKLAITIPHESLFNMMVEKIKIFQETDNNKEKEEAVSYIKFISHTIIMKDEFEGLNESEIDRKLEKINQIESISNRLNNN